MPFNDIGKMQQDEEGNVTGGMFGASPVGRALSIGQNESRLAGIAELVKAMIMGRGGVGNPGRNFKGITPNRIINYGQKSEEGNILPSIREMHENIPMRGQPAQSTSRIDQAVAGTPREVSSIANDLHGIPNNVNSTGSGLAEAGLHRAGEGSAVSQLRALQDLLSRIFVTQSRQ